MTGLVSCTPGRPVKRASASSPLLLKPRHHQQSESHLYIIPSQNRAGVSSPWALVTWWVARITVLMAHDNISAAEAMKHAGDLLRLDRCIRSQWKMHFVAVYLKLSLEWLLCGLVAHSASQCDLLRINCPDWPRVWHFWKQILTVPSSSSISLQPGNRMEEQLPSSERAGQGEHRPSIAVFFKVCRSPFFVAVMFTVYLWRKIDMQINGTIYYFKSVLKQVLKIWLCLLLQNELFEKAKNEILDEVISLSQVTPQHW